MSQLLLKHPIIKLALDLDGVFADFNGQPKTHGFSNVLAVVNEKNLFPSPWEPDSWNWWSALGYRKSEADLAWKFVHGSPHFWATLRPLPFAVDTLAYIQGAIDRHEIQVTFLTTRTSPTAHWQSVEWLQQYGIHRPQVCICHNAHSKAQIARALQVYALVDDYVANLKAMQMHDTGIQRFLLSAPWNVGIEHEAGPGVRHLPNLPALADLIDHLTHPE